MKYLTGRSKKLKCGEQYYFVDTDFDFIKPPKITVKKRTVHRIVTGDFSTKEPGDMYEVERFMAFEDENEAKKYALKQLKDYKKRLVSYLDEQIKMIHQCLLSTNEGNQ
jgi:hypothetical protein